MDTLTDLAKRYPVDKILQVEIDALREWAVDSLQPSMINTRTKSVTLEATQDDVIITTVKED
jgi:hypothetical protein